MQHQQNNFQIRTTGIVGMLMLIGFLVLLFLVARGIFIILAWAAPVLIILALIINYRTVLGFLKYMWNLLRRRPLFGIIAVLLCIVGFPVLSGFLFAKAILDRRVGKYAEAMRRHHEGELTEYVDVTHMEDADTLDLDAPPPRIQPRNTYDDLFTDEGDRK